MMKQWTFIFICLALGELIVAVTGLKLPASIVGMLLLTFFLKLKWIKVDAVDKAAAVLLHNMGLFFVPAGVAIICYVDVISRSFWSIIIASMVSTVVILAVTGWTHQLLRKKR
ncbi:CidA/LrgA family protein [Olivibacter sp. SDN3]|uniref:CidA/LrgA family protein n=1 Tax=Olivibacter sp. SDN3 TaxID=2764720 RepID=UPI00165185C1|nr:CidA/LrgA family protein [Olivibacter sp. SDN3]QNL49766.1 CidA/LrgA family protein [Olivibacter sp. SDN3]